MAPRKTSSTIILDYSKYIEDCLDTYWSEFRSENDALRVQEPKDRGLFFSRRGWCPFCLAPASRVWERRTSESIEDEYMWDGSDTIVWFCSGCGWWDILHHTRSTSDFLGQSNITTRRLGMLRSFDVADTELPINVLRRHIKKKPDTIFRIHPRKMEELVTSVFSDFYSCEAHHVGRSHDGGIDLVLVESDNPIAVQVKRRIYPERSESVRVVREFLGAMVLNDYRHGKLVTSANQFSIFAQKAKQRAITNDIVDTFELIDCKRFFEMLNLISSDKKSTWDRYLPDKFQGRSLKRHSIQVKKPQPNYNHKVVVKGGIDVYNNWRKNNPYEVLYLSGASLQFVNLEACNLSGDISLDDISREPTFEYADLSDGNLANSNLIQSNFRRAILIRTNFCGANLSYANFELAELSDAVFTDANISGASFGLAINITFLQILRTIWDENTDFPAHIERRLTLLGIREKCPRRQEQKEL